MKKTKKIVITGAAGQIGYALAFRIAAGEMLGSDQPLVLSLLEVPALLEGLKGVQMELEDCAFPLLKGIETSSDPHEAFDGGEIFLLVGAKPRGPGMERNDLLAENGKIFFEQGKVIQQRATSHPLILVTGNPCNTNALLAMRHAPKIDPLRFFAMTRLDQNRASALLAQKAKVGVEEVKNVTIWGNHSSTQVPDVQNATIRGKPVKEVIRDSNWLEKDFFQGVQSRGAKVIEARGKSSAGSAANAIIDSVRSLMLPTPSGEWFSVALCSDHNPYGIQKNLIFSFPCRSKGEGKVEIVKGLSWDDFLKKKVAITEKELLEERELVKHLL